MDDGLLARTPPHNLEAEKSVLGAVLIANECLEAVAGILQPAAFYRKAHAQIFTAMLEMQAKSVAIDFVNLQEHLTPKQLADVGGPAYLSSLVDGLPHVSNIEHYAQIVREKATLRQVILSATSVLAKAYDAEEPAMEIIAAADTALVQLAADQVSGDLVPASTLMNELMPVLEHAYEKKLSIVGLPTEWRELDDVTLGLSASDLIVIAARPRVGKTVMGANIATFLAIQNYTTAFFTMEMGRGQIAMRMLAARAGVSYYRMRTGFLQQSDWSRISNGMNEIHSSSLFVDETPGVTVPEVRAKCRRLQRTAGLHLVVLDYLQLMRGVGDFRGNRTQEVGSISRALKGLAKELNVPVIAMCQLSRKPEGRDGGKPQLGDLRDSGEIEQDADQVLLLHRPELYNPTPENEGLCEVHVAKNRSGPEGTVNLRFEKDMVRFVGWNAKPARTLPPQREFSV